MNFLRRKPSNLMPANYPSPSKDLIYRFADGTTVGPTTSIRQWDERGFEIVDFSRDFETLHLAPDDTFWIERWAWYDPARKQKRIAPTAMRVSIAQADSWLTMNGHAPPPAMSDMRKREARLHQALNILDDLGAKYMITLPSGQTVGSATRS
jgi:hypothetical protein